MTDARQFNIRNEAGSLLCPACGYPGYTCDPAYDENGGMIGTTICPCCLWEPGFDDNQHACASAKDTVIDSLRAHRAKWSALSAWQGRNIQKPQDWDGRQQLARLFDLAPNLR